MAKSIKIQSNILKQNLENAIFRKSYEKFAQTNMEAYKIALPLSTKELNAKRKEDKYHKKILKRMNNFYLMTQ